MLAMALSAVNIADDDAPRYTTANPENLDQDFQGTDFKAPMAGFGESTFVLLDQPDLLTTLSCRIWSADCSTLLSILWRLTEVDLNGGVSRI